MQKLSQKHRATQKQLKELRLLIANSIIRNSKNIKALLTDIETADYAQELLDEYSMRYFLLWLATKCGFDAYTKDIQPHSEEMVNYHLETLMKIGWYPFQNSLYLEDEFQIIDSVFKFLDIRIPQNLDLIGIFYEQLTTHSATTSNTHPKDIRLTPNSKYNRRSKGQFYTPPDIVRYCLEESFKEAFNELPGSILDPACGSGNFLVVFLSLAAEKNLDEIALARLVTGGIYGIDIDGRAVSLARFSILFKLFQLISGKNWNEKKLLEIAERLETNLVAIDSTLSVLNNKSRSPVFNGKRFDLVITNPPYVSFGSRDQQEIYQSTARLFKQFYPDSSEYKIRLNAIFHDVAYRFTKDMGRITLLVPDSFLTGRRYARLRKGILNKTKILSLSELSDKTIPNATVGRWCVAVFEKQITKSDYSVKTVSFCENEKNDGTNCNINGQSKVEYSLPLSRLVSADHQRFHLLFNSIDDRIVSKLKSSKKIKHVLRGHTGIRSRIGQKGIISDKKEGSRWQPGLISGSSITPFLVSPSKNWLNIDSKILFSGGFDEHVITNSKILVRQTGDRIIAAVDDQGLYHLNNIHSFSWQKLKAESNTRINLFEVVAWLNSNLFRYLYRLKTREDGMALAQIDIETVEEMPIPENRETQISKATIHLAKLLSTQEHSELTSSHSTYILRCLNRLVYHAYHINEEEIDHIERDLKSRTKGKNFNSALPLVPVKECVNLRSEISQKN